MTAAVLAGTTTTVVRLRRDAAAAVSGTGLVITSRFCGLRIRDLPAGVRRRAHLAGRSRGDAGSAG